MSTIEKILLRPKTEGHIGFPLSILDLMAHDSALAFSLLHFPTLLIPIFDEAILESQNLAIINMNSAGKSKGGLSIKRNCHIRIHQLPPVPQLSKSTIGQIRSFEVDKLIQICGTVVRLGSVKMLHIYKEFECMNKKCGLKFRVCADPEQVRNSFLRRASYVTKM